MTDGVWKYYYPDEGETAEDAEVIRCENWQKILGPESAADLACEQDFNERDGWERTPNSEFIIAVIAPDWEKTETRWKCRHEPSVLHITERDE